jgi:hypothetical protein
MENEAFLVGIGSRKLEGKAFDDFDELFDEDPKSIASSKVRTSPRRYYGSALFWILLAGANHFACSVCKRWLSFLLMI